MKTWYLVAYVPGKPAKIVAERETRKAAETLKIAYQGRYPGIRFRVETD